jgi:hypothetical protein
MRGDEVYLVEIFGKSSVHGFPQERRAQFFEQESARSVTLIKDASDAGGHWVKVAVADGAPMKTAIAPSPTPDDGPAHPWLQKVGPGVVTGAADDESSSIVTYSRARGLLTYPLMVAIQIAADLIAMGAAVNLVVVGPIRIYAMGLELFSLILQVFVPSNVACRRNRSKECYCASP